jgi:hypothetical protein
VLAGFGALAKSSASTSRKALLQLPGDPGALHACDFLYEWIDLRTSLECRYSSTSIIHCGNFVQRNLKN